MKKITFSTLIIAFIALQSCSPSKKSEEASETENVAAETPKEEPSVYFVSPADGDTVSTTFRVEMGLKGMQVQPAGEVNEGFGHHHILVNQTSWPEGEIIPPSDTTVHYGKGQTETDFTLEPGNYILSLQFADGVHRSYGENLAASINITVQ